MINKEQLSQKPFYLSESDMKWVEKTLESMTLDEKISQLFCLIAYSSDEEYLKYLSRHLKVGGVMCRTMSKEEVISTVSGLQANSKIPMLIAANLEAGGNGVCTDGTRLGSQLQVAATDNVEMATRLGEVCGNEGSALGINWAFSPIIDIDFNFRNPITNTRTFGSDPEKVSKMGKAYVEAIQGKGVAASIKHFPGDGVDERDQHLVSSVNDLSCEQWDLTFGHAYQEAIDAGAKTVMVGHILQPAYSRFFNKDLSDEDILPASLSYELVTNLLKEKLGFNGLVITDSTTMAGMLIPLSRKQAVPQAVAAGCDMFLFTKNIEEDFSYMKEGYETGIISKERLHEAVTKILALKASLKLHKKLDANELIPKKEEVNRVLRCNEHLQWEKECADKAITLVKEEKGVLPINQQRYKKVLVYGIETELGTMGFGANEGAVNHFIDHLKDRGYEVDKFKPKPGFEGMLQPYHDIVDKYDLIIYVANMATKSNQTIIRIEWDEPMGVNVPIYMNDTPTIFISLENPYHLLDVPRVRTYINTYGSSEVVLASLINKLEGLSSFEGINPVDPFCGKWDTRL
ncbi:glycoside hydrolase family 3 protein [Halalkalibacter sp. APA_J-10(15)]|uniref:glycoside hydrolase family 3 protein n=1 Tax=Halalkalibacter sp. APA_J-10(15) TaxID=2933805 RepID=UPI001FF5AC60|nr:glycoside hydrolase family 3 N-terminal domain-containing protein [Halalkalibacter sp. APA_J-10(15)]MCK0472786.1 glycoside hydrolase family 3 protein [Halalkalibacter sp. APA_J-10(15)]